MLPCQWHRCCFQSAPSLTLWWHYLDFLGELLLLPLSLGPRWLNQPCAPDRVLWDSCAPMVALLPTQPLACPSACAEAWLFSLLLDSVSCAFLPVSASHLHRSASLWLCGLQPNPNTSRIQKTSRERGFLWFDEPANCHLGMHMSGVCVSSVSAHTLLWPSCWRKFLSPPLVGSSLGTRPCFQRLDQKMVISSVPGERTSWWTSKKLPGHGSGLCLFSAELKDHGERWHHLVWSRQALPVRGRSEVTGGGKRSLFLENSEKW